MKMLGLANWSVRWQVTMGPLLLLLVIIATIIAIWFTFERLQQTSQVVSRTFQAMQIATNLEKSVIDMDTGVRRFALSRDETLLTPYLEGRAEAAERLPALRAMISADAPQQERLDRIAAVVAEWESTVAQPGISRIRAGEDGSAFVRSGEGRRLTDEIRGLVANFLASEQAALTARSRNDQFNETLASVLLSAALGVAFASFLLAYLVANRIITPVIELSSAARRIGGGDLSARVPVRGRNELSDTGQAFNSMAAELAGARDEMNAQHLALARQAAEQQRLRSVAEASEASAQAALARFTSVLDAATEYGIFAANLEGAITVFNVGAERLLGYRADEVVGRFDPAMLLDRSELAARATARGTPELDVLLAAAQHGLVETREWTLVRKDGSRLLASLTITAIRDAGGRIVGYTGVARDITVERQREQQLREREESYRLLLNNAADAIYVFSVNERDERSMFIEVNDAACERYGYTREEFFQLRIDDLLADEWTEDNDRIGDQLQRQGRLVFERLHKARGGRRIPTEVSVHRFDFRGQQASMIIARDITQRKAAEAALSASNERYRLLLNNTSDAILVYQIRPDGTRSPFIDVNDVACQRYGYTREEFLKLYVPDLLAPEQRARSLLAIPQLLETGQLLIERTYLTKDGRRSPVEISSHLFQMDGVPTVLALVRDITERKEAEERLRTAMLETQQRYHEADQARSESRAVLDAVVEAIVMVAPDQRIVAVNRSFAKFFGAEPDAITGRPFSDLKAEMHQVFGNADGLLQRIEATATDASLQFEYTVSQIAPAPREMELFSAPVTGEDGDFLGRLYVLRDVTHEREVDRMKTEFVSLVSHELRTPLTSIKGYIDLLLEREVGDITDEQGEFLTIVKNNADRLVALINNLLDISRIESGRVDLLRIPVDLGHTVQGVATMLGPQIATKRQQLSLNIAAGLPPASGDPDRLIQIVTNLLSNAYKYTPEGGQIAISVQHDGNVLRVSITDSGIGMTPGELDQLFTKFFRARNRVTQEVGGTGLGLAITKSLIELLGGEITVTSAPGQGSTFAFTLPVAETAAAGEGPAVEVQPALRQGGRILVVDDEPDIAGLIQRYLERGGYHVLVARNGADALRLAQTEQPDLITLDVMLPEADGFTVLEWLKQDPSTAAIPVILLSIVSDNGRGMLLGAVDYLTKPVQEAVLIDRVAVILAHEQSRVVLVADDDPDIRNLLVEQLRRAGYQTLAAADGLEAVALARRELPGLAVLDIRMPGLDGVGVLRTLRADAATRQLPVIMMTASPGALEENRSVIESLGVINLLRKPTTVEELAEAIARAFAQAREGNQ